MSDKTKCTETRGDTSPLMPLASPIPSMPLASPIPSMYLASPSEGLSSDLRGAIE